jgi:hypothetical protein
MGVEEKLPAASDLFADSPMKRPEVFSSQESPQGFVRLPARPINRDSSNVLQGNAVV